MSDLSNLVHYFIICPILFIILDALLNFLHQKISTMRRKTWEYFQGNARSENSDDVLSASRSSDNASTYGMIISIFGVWNYLWPSYLWPYIIAKFYSFIHELLQLLRRDNASSGDSNPLMNVTRSTDERNDNQDSDRRQVSTPDANPLMSVTRSTNERNENQDSNRIQRPVSIPDANVRRLRSGRVYDITPMSNSRPIETNHASVDNSQNGPSSSSRGSSRNRRRPLSLTNWFGDAFRMRHEDRLPDHVQRYGRSSSLLTSSSSPFALSNILRSQQL